MDNSRTEVFADGNMTPVVRRGDRVIRSRSPWATASQAVLRHLESVGFVASPRVLTADDNGQEHLSFIPGRSAAPDLTGHDSDTVLVAVGELVRAFHGAMAGFTLPPGAAMAQMPGAPAEGPLICHNDIAPWNVIFQEQRPVALIDWDLVGYGDARWELAYVAWRFVPLTNADVTDKTLLERRRERLSLLLDAYGIPSSGRKGFIDVVLRRQWTAVETVEEWGQAGIPGFDRLYRQGLHMSGVTDREWLKRYQDRLTSS